MAPLRNSACAAFSTDAGGYCKGPHPYNRTRCSMPFGKAVQLPEATQGCDWSIPKSPGLFACSASWACTSTRCSVDSNDHLACCNARWFCRWVKIAQGASYLHVQMCAKKAYTPGGTMTRLLQTPLLVGWPHTRRHHGRMANSLHMLPLCLFSPSSLA